MKKVLLTGILFCAVLNSLAQVVITPKGTRISIDSSKWTISGSNIYNKNSGNVGIGVTIPTAQLHTSSTVRFAGIGTNTVNTNIVTTDASGNLTTRTLSNLLSGNALTSLNGLTNSVQTFATGTTGTDFNIVSSGSTHTFNLPTASASNRGLLSTANWTTFNNKIGTVTAITPAAVTTATTTATINNTAAYWNANLLQGIDIATTTPANGQVLTYNTTTSKWEPAAAAPVAATVSNTNTAPNTLSTTVNGVTGTGVPIVNSVANTSSVNSLSTTVNGVAGSSVNIINSNSLTLSSGALTSTVNGVASSPAVNVLATANNGLTAATGNVQLGGALTQATTITTTASNTLALPGLQNGTSTDSLLVIGTGTGNVIRKVAAPASFPQLLVDARKTNSYTPAAGYATIVYNTAAINVGTAYSTSTGTFTAPATGLYEILINNGYALSSLGTAQIVNRIIVNGVVDMEDYTSGNSGLGGANYSLSASTIVSITAGQTVTIASGGLAGTATPLVGTGQHVMKIIRLQ